MKGVRKMSAITVWNEKNILFYSDENGQIKVEVILQDENVWLNVNSIAILFDVQRPAIVKHINNIYIMMKNWVKNQLVPFWNKFKLKEHEV